MSYPSSRRYARTLAQAFPRDPAHACALELHRRPLLQRLSRYAGPVLLGIAFGALIVLAIRATF